MVKLVDLLGLVSDKKEMQIVEFRKITSGKYVGKFGGLPICTFKGNKHYIASELGDDYTRYVVIDIIENTIQIGIENKEESKDSKVVFSV